MQRTIQRNRHARITRPCVLVGDNFQAPILSFIDNCLFPSILETQIKPNPGGA